MKDLVEQLKSVVNSEPRETETFEDLEKIAERTQTINYFKDVKKESLLERILPKCYRNFTYEPKFDLLNEETLFYIFYAVPDSEIQLVAYNELIKKDFVYSKTLNCFIFPKNDLSFDQRTKTIEVFDIEEWKSKSITVTCDTQFINGLERKCI